MQAEKKTPYNVNIVNSIVCISIHCWLIISCVCLQLPALLVENTLIKQQVYCRTFQMIQLNSQYYLLTTGYDV